MERRWEVACYTSKSWKERFFEYHILNFLLGDRRWLKEKSLYESIRLLGIMTLFVQIYWTEPRPDFLFRQKILAESNFSARLYVRTRLLSGSDRISQPEGHILPPVPTILSWQCSWHHTFPSNSVHFYKYGAFAISFLLLSQI